MNCRSGNKLPEQFYARPDVERISRELLGMHLFTMIEGEITGGIIRETEAYGGTLDRACHAYGERRTRRTEIMYASGGVAYVYRCYGIHWLLNVVTNGPQIPEAILIRAVEPTDGLEVMMRRRGKFAGSLTVGPGNLTRAMGIDGKLNGASLQGPQIWIEDRGLQPPPDQIMAGPRIGVAYAGADALRPWRFWVKGIIHDL